MAIKAWETGLAAAIGAGFFYFMWRVRRAASPDKLLGQVQDIRCQGRWTFGYGRLLVIRYDTHGTPMVRMQFRQPGSIMALRLNAREALRLASLLRQAAAIVNAEPAPLPLAPED